MKYAERMKRIVPSGIRKVNEKALEMERNGETVIHFEIGRPDFVTPDYIRDACIRSIKEGASSTLPTSGIWNSGKRWLPT